ncbi:serine hydrolase domain-containing protein [Erythrobacter sp. HA6-11]
MKKHTATAMAVCAAALCFTAPANAQKSSGETVGNDASVPASLADKVAVRGIIAEYIDQGKLEAVSVGITHQGKAMTIHEGPLYRGQSAPASDQTIYEIRSITKTFTGTLAAQAILDGKLSLNSDIRAYLVGEYGNLERDGQPILLRHLLTHTSGLPSNNPLPDRSPDGDGQSDAGGLEWRDFRDAELSMTREKFFENLAAYELASVPGETFNYSNLGTNLTAQILENVYGKTLDELVRDFILIPAGMEETALSISDPEMLSRTARGYNANGELIEPWPVWPMGGAEGAAKATVPDTVRYMQFHLNERHPAVKLSHVPLLELASDYRIASFWWVIDRPAGTTSYRHDGGYANVRNVMILFPEQDLGIYAVTNRVTPEANEILTELVFDLREALLETER